MQKPGSKTVVKFSWRSSSQLRYLFIFFFITDKLFCLTPQSTRDHFRVKSRTPHNQSITLRRWAALPHHHAHCTETTGLGLSECTHMCAHFFTLVANSSYIHKKTPQQLSLHCCIYWSTSKSGIYQSHSGDISGLLSHEAVRTQQILKLIEIHLYRSM